MKTLATAINAKAENDLKARSFQSDGKSFKVRKLGIEYVEYDIMSILSTNLYHEDLPRCSPIDYIYDSTDNMDSH